MTLTIQERLKDLRVERGLMLGQRPGTSVFAVYLQTAQAELQEAVRGRTEVAEKDCGETGLAEKSKTAERAEAIEQ